MDKKVIDQIIQLVGDQTAIKAVCNITGKGPIDEKVHSKKIERARAFGLLENDSLTLTELGKLFAAKLFLDLADNVEEGGSDDEEDVQEDDGSEFFRDLDEEDYDDEEWDDEGWDDEDWDDDDEDDDDYGPRRKGNRRRN